MKQKVGAKDAGSRKASPKKPWDKTGPKRPAAKKPQKLDVGAFLKASTPLPANVDALRGVHALPGFKSQIPFAAWCVRLGKRKVLEQLVAKHPSLLHELGLNGRSVLHTAASKGPAFVTLLLEAGLDPLLADHEGRLPVDMAIKAGNKAVVRVLAPAGDLDSQVLLDYPEFARRVSAGEAPRLPTDAVTAVLRRARLRVDSRDPSGESRATAASQIAGLIAHLRALGARPQAAAALEVHFFRSEALAVAYLKHGAMSARERAELTEALASRATSESDAEAERFAQHLVALCRATA